MENHLADHGELLLHVLMADVRRWLISAFYNLQDDTETMAVLELLEEALSRGDARLENAVAISFVEDSCPWHPRMGAFVDAWPGGLRREAERQRSTP